MPLSAGDKLGAYEILALIGRGGMGAVYRARDPRLGRDVAIKVLPDEFADDTDWLSRFQREARVVAALNHPHIVTIFSVEEAGGVHFLTMELIDGQTLARAIPAGGMPFEQFAVIAAELADALAAAHEKGIVHRDLKPGNVMVTRDGRVKVLDFGLAREVRSIDPQGEARTALTQPGVDAVIGTPGYMSPEQVSGGPIDHRSDIFSLGIVLHQMATGQNPFSGASSAEQSLSILRDAPPSLSQIRPELPSELARIVRRCLEKDPRRRIQTARDVANEIQEIAGHVSAKAQVAGTSAPSPVETHAQLDSAASGGQAPASTKQGRFRKRWVIAVFAFAAALAAGFWYLHHPLPPPRITEYTQITHDGHEKFNVLTDGSRLYFEQASPESLAEVSITGGEVANIPIAKPPLNGLDEISPDGASLLISSREAGNPSFELWIVRILGGTSRRIVDGVDGSFSPDGDSLAYETEEGGIWIIGSDGSGAHKLASEPEMDCCIHWSPDSKALRVTRHHHIWELASDGSNFHPLLSGPRALPWECCGRWTPDGKFFVFVSEGSTNGETREIWALDERRGLFRQPSATPIQLTTGPTIWNMPLPSKDGKKIFALRKTERGELSRLDPRTQRFEPFLGGISVQGVTFSPDGQSVAYVSFPEGDLWKANRDGSDSVQLTKSPLASGIPRWSPDSKQIVFEDQNSLFEDQNSPASAIYIVSPDGGTPRRLLPEDTRAESDPNWSLDGHKIVYASGDLDGPPEKIEIRIIDLDSRKATTVPGSVGLFSPRWSPDGRFIAATPSPQAGMKIFNVATGQWSELPIKIATAYPEWSKDSQSIYFLNPGATPGLFRIRVNGGKAEMIADLKDLHISGWWSAWMGLDPTDAPLVLRDIGSDDVFALTFEEK